MRSLYCLFVVAVPLLAQAAPVPATLSPPGKPLFEAKTPEEAAIALKRLKSQPFLEILQRLANERGYRDTVQGRFRGEKVGERRVRIILEGVEPEKVRLLEATLTEMMTGQTPEKERRALAAVYEEMKRRFDRLEQLGARLPPQLIEQERARMEAYQHEMHPPVLRKLR